MGDHSWIGHFNVVLNDNVTLGKSAYIQFANLVKGPFDLILGERSSLGKSNTVNRGKIGVSYGYSHLKLGVLSKVTARHYLDLTRSVTMGNYTTLAGLGSQIWTHGYNHAPDGPERYRVDGEVHIGNNIYIGSLCLINPGVSIADVITIGGNAAISKSLTEPGLYVSQPLRYIPKQYEDGKMKLSKVNYPDLMDVVYEKKT
jgi:acetyltransferase-like isoleucine patch superfamily enzyme